MEQENTHRQRKKDLIEENNVINPFISNSVNNNLKKKGIGFGSGCTFITVNRSYTSEWNDY